MITRLFQHYVERDLAHLFGVELTTLTLRNFWSMLADANGNIWNAETFARSLGISAPTVLRHQSPGVLLAVWKTFSLNINT